MRFVLGIWLGELCFEAQARLRCLSGIQNVAFDQKESDDR